MESWVVLLALAVLAVPVLLGVALVMLVGLRQRVAVLEARVAALRAEAGSVEALAEPTLEEWMRSERAAGRAPPEPTMPARPAPEAAPRQTPPAGDRPGSAVPPPLPPLPPSAPVYRPPPRPASPDPLTLAARMVRRWFTEGNVPVKVGMLVLLAGVAALLKYASDQGWLRMPIELRLAGVAAAALAGLVFGWRQREGRRSFGLALQGGAVGVLLLTVFAAYRLYGLVPASAAFGLSIVLVAALGVLAVAQNARALAVFGLLAGFLAPLWLSTGQGSHVALFGYYAVLNVAIFAIAWARAWRLLNVLGFVFTFAIGTAWGVLKYRPEHFATTEPFLLLFFALYVAIPLLYARARAPGRRDLVDGCLLFGVPLVAFSLQAALLHDARMTLAFNALGLGAIYAALAAAVRRSDRLGAFLVPYAVLAVGFATLAVPLALSAQATASVFALEGAGLMWLGIRQRRRLPQVSGALLQLASAVALLYALLDGAVSTPPVANAPFMAALLLALAGFASAWAWWREADALPHARAMAGVFLAWGLAWWCGGAVREIELHVAFDARLDAVIAFAAATAWLAGEAFRRERAAGLAWVVALALGAGLLLVWPQQTVHTHALGGYGALAWAVYALLGLRALQTLRDHTSPVRAVAHLCWLVAWSVLALSDGARGAVKGFDVGGGWPVLAELVPVLALAMATEWRPAWVGVPFGPHFEGWRDALRAVLAAVLVIAAFGAMSSPDGGAPLPYVPLLNPVDLAEAAILAMLAVLSRHAPAPVRAWRMHGLAALGLALITASTLRAVHQLGEVPWDPAMWRAGMVQTALTVVWSVLGVAGWIAGSRRGLRGLWLAGALLMAVVLAKLVLVDRSHLGNLLGIVSFLAYGMLCTAVGYFAPVPPRTAAQGGVS